MLTLLTERVARIRKIVEGLAKDRESGLEMQNLDTSKSVSTDLPFMERTNELETLRRWYSGTFYTAIAAPYHQHCVSLLNAQSHR